MRIAVSLLLLAGCGNDIRATDTDAVTYWQDVEPIFQTNCITCHTDGGIGPFPLDNAETAAQLAPAIVAETEAGLMPPWPPGPDTPPLRHVRALTEDQLATIKAWSMGGAQVGDPTNPQPHEPPEVIDIGPTELGFDIGLDYVPDTSLSDDYRCFLADVGATELRGATGFKVTPGNRAIVHHVIVTMVAGADRPTLEALDAETARAGWPCVGGAVPTDLDVQVTATSAAGCPGCLRSRFPRARRSRCRPAPSRSCRCTTTSPAGRMEIARASTSRSHRNRRARPSSASARSASPSAS
jgi:mono/diheme cytochrome c family protein